jgi:hypothetical protein
VIANTAYRVVSEFRFEVGGAIASSEQLQGAIEGLSNAADRALVDFSRLSGGIVAQFGLGAGGLAGTIMTAVKAADKFRMSQIAMANLMTSGSFDERLAVASEHMEKINRLASEFALPADDLLMLTKLTAPMIRDKNGAPNFNSAIDLSRNLMKAAPTLGLDTSMVMGQLQRSIGGQASLNDTFFQRLVSDTRSMHGMSSQKFNSMDEHKRVETLRKALKEFTSDTRVLEANVRTLNGQWTLLKNNVAGATGVLSEIGKVVMKFIIPAFQELNAYLQNQGRKIAKSLALGLEPWMEGGWRQMVVNLMQAKSLFADLKSAVNIVTFVASMLGLHEVLKLLGIRIPIVSGALAIMSSAVHKLEADLLSGALSMKVYGRTGLMIAQGGFMGFIARMALFANRLTIFLSRALVPLAGLIFLFQLFSRAAAIAKIDWMERLVKDYLPRLAAVGATFSRLWAMFMEGFDNLARVIAPVFDPTKFLGVIDLFEIFTSILEFISTVTTLAVAGFQALTFAILEFVNQIKELVTGNGFSFGRIGDAFNAGADDVFERIYGKIKDGSGGTSGHVTNINKVEINNAFKEQSEPDRIAFTLKEQLIKAAINPQQGSRSLRQGLLNP